MSIKSIKLSMRLDHGFAAAFGVLWVLALGAGVLLDSERLFDFSLIPMMGVMVCLFSLRVRYDLLDHVRETEPEEGA